MSRGKDLFSASGAASPYDDYAEDLNPSAGLANLSDCMLVLACGLMVALVVAWNVDLPSVTEVIEGEKQEVTDLEDITDEENTNGNSYNELGMVYQDPDTGKMYLITETGGEDAEGAEGEEADGSGSSGAAAGELSTSQTGTSAVPKAGASSADAGDSAGDE